MGIRLACNRCISACGLPEEIKGKIGDKCHWCHAIIWKIKEVAESEPQ